LHFHFFFFFFFLSFLTLQKGQSISQPVSQSKQTDRQTAQGRGSHYQFHSAASPGEKMGSDQNIQQRHLHVVGVKSRTLRKEEKESP